MIFNYLKIAWRNLVKQRLFSIINISGLAVGLAVFMMIMMYIAHETSYDGFHKNADRIFGAHYINSNAGNIMDFIKHDSGEAIKQSQPVVEAYMGTLEYQGPVTVSNPLSPQQKISEEKLLFADPGFFNFFSFKLLSGQAANVLKVPFSIVISRDMAKKYFGGENPIGKTITLKTDSTYTYQVTGVAENCPSNSSISFNFVASTPSLKAMKGNFSYGNTYLLLKHAADTAILRHNEELTLKKDGGSFPLIPMPDMHLKNVFSGYSKINYLKIFPLVAVLILLLALVNYMSLSTARATLRAKEVGVRKVSGASRKSIALQFYVESALFALLSFVLGYLLCYAVTPWFLNVLQLKIDDSFLHSPLVLTLLFALLVLTILIAGSYPSLVLSSFKPVTTLKGKISKNAGGNTVRKVFTTLQFTISVGLIICGIVIDRQLYFFRHADTGINRDNVVMIPVSNSFGKNFPAFNHDIRSLAGVSQVAISGANVYQETSMLMVKDKTTNEDIIINSLDADEHFIPVLNLKWKSAPLPDTDIAGPGKIVVNEKAIEKLHMDPRNVAGKYIESGGLKYAITGVLKNFNFTSMAYAIEPMAVIVSADSSSLWKKDGCNLYAKIKPHTNLPSLLNTMQSIYKKYDHETPFSYSFMDDAFNQQYKTEERLSSVFSVFTSITVILAALGLFGLAAFTIEQRTKEIGIRKVLGASFASINALLSFDFLKLVILAIVIASPVAWWAMHNWLQSFAYRITISWWIFAIAGMLAICTAVITVSYHAVKAAFANPVKSLRSE